MNTMGILPFQSEYVTKGEFYELKNYFTHGFEKAFEHINTVEMNLSAKIDGTEFRLSKKIDNIELKLNSRISSLETKIDASKEEIIVEIETKLDKKLEKNKNEIVEALSK